VQESAGPIHIVLRAKEAGIYHGRGSRLAALGFGVGVTRAPS
jgi:hypothetical protein